MGDQRSRNKSPNGSQNCVSIDEDRNGGCGAEFVDLEACKRASGGEMSVRRKMRMRAQR